MFRSARWFVTGSLGGAGVGASVAYFRYHDWDLRSSGLVRFGRAAYAISLVAYDYKSTLKGYTGDEPEYRKVISQVHRRSAERLRDMCSANGGCFIKVGQHIGALDYLVPGEYVETLRVFHDRAPQSRVEDVYKVLKLDLGKEVDELFSEFDETPVGTASLAQVHRARLKDGTTVAVKVQHPRVKAHSYIDMKSMELLVKIVAWAFPEFQFLWVAEETKRNLPLELDFIHEGKNCERVGSLFSHLTFLKVPKVHWDLTTEKVLTMEFCEGGRVVDQDYMKKNNISVEEISRRLGELYSEMIFVQGYVHCDPHPGNILINKHSDDVQLVLLDHGLYTRLTPEFRLNYSQLWLSIIRADLAGIKHWSGKLGCGHMFGLLACVVSGRSWDAISRGIDRNEFTEEENLEIQNNAANYLPEISEILNKVPREMLLVFKTNDLLRGIECKLNTRGGATSLITMSRCCVQAVYHHRREELKDASWWSSWKLKCEKQMALLRLSVYEWLLWATNVTLSLREHFTSRRKRLYALTNGDATTV